MIKYVNGDLLKSDCNIIIHGCNCFHSMSGGIAWQIANLYPQACQADELTPLGDIKKLGTYSLAKVKNAKEDTVLILNCYTQFYGGVENPSILYDSIKSVMLKIKNDFDSKYVIGMPKIGCGIAGGDWSFVGGIINEVFGEREVLVFIFP